VFDDLTSASVFGLLTEARVAEVARMRLGELLGSQPGRVRLTEAAVWLRFNGAWEPAARQLGLHRHTLKERITELGEQLALPLESFHGRAELWALLAASGVAHE
jgi:purine catabolism regulator